MKFLIPVIAIASLLLGCQSKSHTKKGTDLLSFGIPYTIQAPDAVSLSKIGSGTMADVNIKNKNGYDVQVFMSDAFTSDIAKLKQLKKEQVTTHPEFSKIVEEFDQGFLFEKKSIAGEISYDFMIVQVLGDKEINFQAGNSKLFSESETKSMIKSILDAQ